MPPKVTCKICGKKEYITHCEPLAYFGMPTEYGCGVCRMIYINTATKKCEELKLKNVEDRKTLLFFGVGALKTVANA